MPTGGGLLRRATEGGREGRKEEEAVRKKSPPSISFLWGLKRTGRTARTFLALWLFCGSLHAYSVRMTTDGEEKEEHSRHGLPARQKAG